MINEVLSNAFFQHRRSHQVEGSLPHPPLERIDLDEVMRLIEEKRYFVMHAPRQTGKTSALLALMGELNEIGRYRCLYIMSRPPSQPVKT